MLKEKTCIYNSSEINFLHYNLKDSHISLCRDERLHKFYNHATETFKFKRIHSKNMEIRQYYKMTILDSSSHVTEYYINNNL